jgi:hypothetical protein
LADNTLSPNMSLPVPNVGVSAGPQYATDVNNSLNIVDAHNHTAGSGVQINPAGININADLPFNGNNATLLRTANFQAQASPLAGSSPDLGCLYVSGADLYYNDKSGNQIRITQSGSVAGSAGTITGLPSGTAGAAFAAATFTFQSQTNTPANLSFGSALLGNNNTNGYALTLSPPSLGSNYQLFLPTIPAQTNVMTLDSSGNMGSATWDFVGQSMTSVGANAIGSTMTSTGANAVRNSSTRSANTGGLGGIGVSSSSGTYSTSSTSPTSVISTSVLTSGRPVSVFLTSDGSGSRSNLVIQANQIMTVLILRNGTEIYRALVGSGTGAGFSINTPSSSVSTLDFVGAGSYTYTLQVFVSGATGFVDQTVLIAYEIS